MSAMSRQPDPDHQRLNALLNEHGARLKGLLFSYHLDRYGIDPDEIAQQVRIRLWHAIERDRSRPFAASYIQRIVASTVIDAMRRNKVRPSEPLPDEAVGQTELPDGAQRPDHQANDDQRMAILQRCLAATPERRRIPMELHLQGFEFREIGASMGISDEAARKLVSRGLKELRAQLRACGLDANDD